jgi:REP element-mobilizing transposase RayT
MPKLLHKNFPKRLCDPAAIYFVTSKTAGNFPFFQEEIFAELFITELGLCKNLKQFELFGFCLNYDHFHLLLRPGKTANLSEILRSLKANYSRDLNALLAGAVPEPRLQGKQFSQKLQKTFLIPNLAQLQTQYHSKYKTKNPFPAFAWQRSFHDHLIRNAKDYQNHELYILENYHKHGLPEDWRWRSENFPELIDALA